MKNVFTFFKVIVLLIFLTFSLHSQIIISEIMQNPASVSDANGEWIELYNAGGSNVDIEGWRISDLGTNSHIINNGGPLMISSGGFLILGNNSDSAINGGVPVDYEYPGSFTIGNSDDEIILEDTTPTEIDRIEYDGGTTWPDPTGASMVFVGLLTDDNNVGSNWLTATSREPNWINDSTQYVDLGSPGTNGTDQSLPVELSSFTAVGGNAQVLLKWITHSEVDNQGFILERSNNKTGIYHQLASYENDSTLRGAGNSSAQKVYKYVDKGFLINGQTYWYKLIDVDVNGVRTEHPVISAVPHASSTDLDVIDNQNLPKEFALNGNFPNPFNPETTIIFDIPESENKLINVNLSIYNMLGQKINTLINEPLSANAYRVKWFGKDGSDKLVPSGIYFYILKTTDYISSHKMMLIK